jgi:hypothetical protein
MPAAPSSQESAAHHATGHGCCSGHGCPLHLMLCMLGRSSC